MLLKDLFAKKNNDPKKNSFGLDVSLKTYQADVIDASHHVPVIVDFWAPWCEPCKHLTPLLEKVAKAYGDRIILAKINVDEEPDIAQQLRIQSLPTVYFFVNGQPVDGFMGAIDEKTLLSMLNKWVPPVDEPKGLPQAQKLMKEKDFYRAKVALYDEPSFDGRLLSVLLDFYLGNVDGLEEKLSAIVAQGERETLSNSSKTIHHRLKLLLDMFHAISLIETEKNPSPQNQALFHFKKGRVDDALYIMVDIFKETKGDESVKKSILLMLEIVGFEHPLALTIRKEMSKVLFS